MAFRFAVDDMSGADDMQAFEEGRAVVEILAVAASDLGGRAVLEGGLYRLISWKLVADHRIYDLEKRGNVKTFSQSPMNARDTIDLEIPNVLLATRAKWRADGVGRSSWKPTPTAS